MKDIVLPTEDNLKEFVGAWWPLMATIFSSVLGGRSITPSDDAWSYLLAALAEAAERYDPRRGSVAGLVKAVGRRRAIDFLRREDWRNREVPFSSLEKEDSDESFEEGLIDSSPNSDPVAILLGKEQAEEFSVILHQFGVRADWWRVTNQHADALSRVGVVVRCIVESEMLLSRFLRIKKIPKNSAAAISGVSPRTIDRYREMIVGAVLYCFYLRGGFLGERRKH